MKIFSKKSFVYRLLYITAKPSVLNQNGFCDLDSRYINPKKFMVRCFAPFLCFQNFNNF